MKNLIKATIAIILCSSCFCLKAQQPESGVYLTEKDYLTHQLNYVLGPKDKLQLNEFLGGSQVSVNYQGKTIRLPKKDLYGYRLQNRDYRFFRNESYQVIDSAGFILYSRQKLAPQFKGYKTIDQYFFSTNALAPVQELNLYDLENSFPDQAGFRYAVKSYFRYDNDLMAYDKAVHQYEIKYLYFQHDQVLAVHQHSGHN